ncbi:cation-transporting P-type ATPase [Yersinia aldovae]|uniref:cation-transporting P-type ATPase n=1 Tax=Yersinia aldovae TaxID=29483 RepID=UPI0002D442D1|nr:cation-transporting P-type ATPase [Yersinia aldovae]
MQNSSDHKSASPPPEGKAWYQLTAEESLQHLNSSEEGLSQQEAKERLKQYGPNALPAKKSKASTAAILSPF